MICPKCNHERTNKDDPLIPDYQCPQCGIIYAKFKTEADKVMDNIRHDRAERKIQRGNEEKAEQKRDTNKVDAPNYGYRNIFIASFFASLFIIAFVYLKSGTKASELVFLFAFLLALFWGVFYLLYMVYRLINGEKFVASTNDVGESSNLDMKSLFIGGVIGVSVLLYFNGASNSDKKKPDIVKRQRQKQRVKDDLITQRNKELAAQQRKIERKRKEAECKKEIDCIGEKLAFTAGFICQNKIEKLAKYQVKWTDGWLDSKFTHYMWKSSRHKVVTVAGDKVQFQNGFGAMQKYVYFCDIDIDDNSVVGVRAQPGRL